MTANQLDSSQIQNLPSGSGDPSWVWFNIVPYLASGITAASDWFPDAVVEFGISENTVRYRVEIKKASNFNWYDYLFTIPVEVRPAKREWCQGFSGGNSASGFFLDASGNAYAFQTYGQYMFVSGEYEIL